jgi:2-succinyl-5-enolpyruvyl-6-hydroxy-3-cyclohexene-1-carboxylate synthase
MTIDLATANAQRADDVVLAVMNAGVTRFFVCPGSRSTPLVFALARAGAHIHVMLDERGAGFAAVGVARAGGLAAVLTTSGTAVSNLLPAMCEADAAELCWVALTADRPRSAIGTGANQTLDQTPLLAGAARVTVDLDAPGEDNASLSASSAVQQAMAHARGLERGPVHINVRFSKPLEPPQGYATKLVQRTRLAPTAVQAPDLTALESRLSSSKRGVIVVAGVPESERDAVAAFCAQLPWPVLWDITAPGFHHFHNAATIAVLRSSEVRMQLRPDTVLWLGGTSTEETVYAWLKECGAAVHQLRCGRRIRDPMRVMTSSQAVDFRALGKLRMPRSSIDVGTMNALRAGSWATHPHFQQLTEPAVASVVAASMRAGECLVLGNSMPVRDVERFAVVPRNVNVLVNRGVSGIDGNIATALGAALESRAPVTMLIGDLAALHDSTGLLAVSGAAQVNMRIVVINNDGGGIFSFLPVHTDANRDVFEKCFGTPHGRSLASIARGFGINAHTVNDLQTLTDILATAPVGVSLVEVNTHRQVNEQVHRTLDAVWDANAATLQTQRQPAHASTSVITLVHGAFGNGNDWDQVRALLPMPSVTTELHAPRSTSLRLPPAGVWLGYSMGARVVLQQALAALAAPAGQFPAALILESPHPGIEDEAARAKRRADDDALADDVERDPQRAVSTFYDRPLFAAYRRLPHADAAIRERMERAVRDPSTTASTLRALSLGHTTPMWASLHTLHMPVLILNGSDDPDYVRIGQRMVQLLPRAVQVLVPGASHNVHDTAPTAFADAIAQWWAELRRSP